MSLFKKISKYVLIGGGTVLSLFAPAIGAPLVVAGTNIDTGKSVDKLSGYAANLETAKTQAKAMGAAQTVAGGGVVTSFRNNPLMWVAGAVGVFLLLKTFKIIR
jgi:hypothetical protein